MFKSIPGSNSFAGIQAEHFLKDKQMMKLATQNP